MKVRVRCRYLRDMCTLSVATPVGEKPNILTFSHSSRLVLEETASRCSHTTRAGSHPAADADMICA